MSAPGSTPPDSDSTPPSIKIEVMDADEIKADKAEEKLLNKKFHTSSSPWTPKQLTAFVSSMAALIAGVAAWHRPPQEPTAEMVYKVLAVARQEDVRLITQNHDDIVTLRFWLSQYLTSQGINPDNPSFSKMAPVVSPVGTANPPPSETVPPASRLFDKGMQSPMRPKIGKTDIRKMPALPDIAPPTISVVPLPGFDKVKNTQPINAP
jgi:hypothetical protein